MDEDDRSAYIACVDAGTALWSAQFDRRQGRLRQSAGMVGMVFVRSRRTRGFQCRSSTTIYACMLEGNNEP